MNDKNTIKNNSKPEKQSNAIKGETIADRAKYFAKGGKKTTNNNVEPPDMKKLDKNRIDIFEPNEEQQDTVLNKNNNKAQKKTNIPNAMKILNEKETIKKQNEKKDVKEVKEKDVKVEEKKDVKEKEVKNDNIPNNLTNNNVNNVKKEEVKKEVKVEENQDKKEVEVKEEEAKVAEKNEEEKEGKVKQDEKEDVKKEEKNNNIQNKLVNNNAKEEVKVVEEEKKEEVKEKGSKEILQQAQESLDNQVKKVNDQFKDSIKNTVPKNSGIKKNQDEERLKEKIDTKVEQIDGKNKSSREEYEQLLKEDNFVPDDEVVFKALKNDNITQLLDDLQEKGSNQTEKIKFFQKFFKDLKPTTENIIDNNIVETIRAKLENSSSKQVSEIFNQYREFARQLAKKEEYKDFIQSIEDDKNISTTNKANLFNYLAGKKMLNLHNYEYKEPKHSEVLKDAITLKTADEAEKIMDTFKKYTDNFLSGSKINNFDNSDQKEYNASMNENKQENSQNATQTAGQEFEQDMLTVADSEEADKSAFRDFVNHIAKIGDKDLLNDLSDQLGIEQNAPGEPKKDEIINAINDLPPEQASVIVANFIDQHPGVLKSEKAILDQYRDNLKDDSKFLAENRKSINEIEKEFAEDEKDNIKKVSDLQKAFEQSLELDKKLSPIKHVISKILFMLPRSWFRSSRTNALEQSMDKIAAKLLNNQSTHEKLSNAKVNSIDRQLNTTEAMAQIMDETRKTTGLTLDDKEGKIKLSIEKKKTQTSVDKQNIQKRIIQIGGLEKKHNGCYSAGVSAKTTNKDNGMNLP